MDRYEVGTVAYLAFIVCVSSTLIVLVYANHQQNTKEHEELRNMDCSNPPELLKWAAGHTTWVDHQLYARQLFVVCTIGGDKPTLNH